MKCIHCHAEIEQDARFCPNCGKDLSEYNRCIKCGELLDKGTSFCPYCGIEQPHYDESRGIKKWPFVILFLLIIGVGAWFLLSGSFSFGEKTDKSRIEGEFVDSTAVETDNTLKTQTKPQEVAENYSDKTDIERKKEFIRRMYKDFFENRNFETQNVNNLRKYLSDNVIDRIYVECPYDGCEGEKDYVIDFFHDGALSYERPDYGDKVVKREINNIDYEWFEVVNIWDVIDDPVKVRIKIKTDDSGNYKVVDIK